MVNVTGPAQALGRLPNFDDRSRAFPIRAALPAAIEPRSYTWRCPIVINQGAEGTCVGHAWAHEMAARPGLWGASSWLARLLYRLSVEIDPWPENDGPDWQFGTDVLSCAKQVKALGFMPEYRWAFGIDDLVLALGYNGPAVLGVPWYTGMFAPDAAGVLHISGRVEGGHAILANGVNVTKRLIRLHNSWGDGWGIGGEALISFDDLDRLLHEQGEACIPILRKG